MISADHASEPLPTLLALGAHPDDIEIGCAGSLLRWAHRYHLVFVVATDGGRSRPAGADRVVEAEKVAASFGADLHVLGLGDGDLGAIADVIASLEDVGARTHPTRVLVPCHRDSHQDHRRLGRAARAAFRRVDEVFAYESHSTEQFAPTYFVDIGAHIDRKCELLSLYESQLGKVAVSEEYVRTNARRWSLTGCHADGYVEAFEVVRFVERDR
jgi:LmbE family N-acetylglucosaminyl deacetylase